MAVTTSSVGRGLWRILRSASQDLLCNPVLGREGGRSVVASGSTRLLSTSAEASGGGGGSTSSGRGSKSSRSSSGGPTLARALWNRLNNIPALATLGVLTGSGIYLAAEERRSEAAFAATGLVSPLIRKFLDAETAHDFAIWLAKKRLVPVETRPDAPCLAVNLWGMHFPNPIGLAAGFDKSAEGVDGLIGIGFGFVEVGSITPLPQPGNPKPRVFRLEGHRAVINRYGFNNDGAEEVAARLCARAEALSQQPLASNATARSADGTIKQGLIGVNLGKNKHTEDAASDYEKGVKALAEFADYLVINVSSPNTPGLRALQSRKELENLIKRVKTARDALPWGQAGPPPLLVKIAPDLTPADIQDICKVAVALRIDGLIVSNTTISRPESIAEEAHGGETGGLSGPPLFDLSTEVLRQVYRITRGRIPLIGCGGVASGRDAYLKIRAGASLIQVYTAMAYEGPSLVPRIKAELAQCLVDDEFKAVQQAVGVDAA